MKICTLHIIVYWFNLPDFKRNGGNISGKQCGLDLLRAHTIHIIEYVQSKVRPKLINNTDKVIQGDLDNFIIC